MILPVAEAQAGFAAEVLAELKRKSLRAVLDSRKKRSRGALRKLTRRPCRSSPWSGPREAEARSVTLRPREGAQIGRPLSQGVEWLAQECASPFAEALRHRDARAGRRGPEARPGRRSRASLERHA